MILLTSGSQCANFNSNKTLKLPALRYYILCGPNTPRLLGPGVEKQTAADDHRRGRRGPDVRGVSGTGHQDDRVPEEGRGLLHAQVI